MLKLNLIKRIYAVIGQNQGLDFLSLYHRINLSQIEKYSRRMFVFRLVMDDDDVC